MRWVPYIDSSRDLRPENFISTFFLIYITTSDLPVIWLWKILHGDSHADIQGLPQGKKYTISVHIVRSLRLDPLETPAVP